MSLTGEQFKLFEEINLRLDEIAGEYGDEIDIDDDIRLITTVCRLFKERYSRESDYYKKQYTDILKNAIEEELHGFYKEQE